MIFSKASINEGHNLFLVKCKCVILCDTNGTSTLELVDEGLSRFKYLKTVIEYVNNVSFLGTARLSAI